jgi:hypothetical protein
MYKVNVILVVGHEKLNVEMQRTYARQLTVVKIPKSGGVRIPHEYFSSFARRAPSRVKEPECSGPCATDSLMLAPASIVALSSSPMFSHCLKVSGHHWQVAEQLAENVVS